MQFDFVIFGSLTKTADNKQSYQLDYYSRSAKKITDRKIGTGESVLDVISVVDRLTGDMLGSIVNNKISFGSLEFANRGNSGDYDIYIDTAFIQTNPNRFKRVPSGEHTVRVVQKATGKDILTQKVKIVKGQTEKLEFELKDETVVVLQNQQKGMVRFESGTQGKIYIGQEFIGDIGPDSPLVSDTLQTGSIDIRFMSLNGTTETKTVTVSDKVYVTVAFGAIAAGEAVSDESAQILNNVRDINQLIQKSLPKNSNAISEKSQILTDVDKTNLYAGYAKKSLGAFSINAWFLPVSIGSFMQGDVKGGVITTAMKVTGITGFLCFSNKYANNRDPGVYGYAFWGSVGMVAAGEIISLIAPFTYASGYNKQLNKALNISTTVQVQPTVSFIPVNGAPGFMMGMNVKY